MSEHKKLDPKSPIKLVKGIGEKTEQLLGKLDIYTVNDFLQHFPRDYDVYDVPVSVKSVLDSIEEMNFVSVKAKIEHVYPIKQVRNLKLLRCRVSDESGLMYITWFNMPYLRRQLRVG